MMASEELVVFLRGQIGDFQRKMKTAQGEIETLGKKGKGGFDKLATVGKAAFLGIAGAATAIGFVAVKQALEGEKAHARLVNAIASTGAAYKTYAGQIDGTSERLAKFGFQNADVEDSIAKIARVTKNTGKAIAEQGLIADIARGRNIALADAAQILVKVHTGHVAALGRLGIATKDATGKTISQQQAIARLSQMYGGAAAQNAKTFAGKMQAVEAQAKNLAERLGNALIPVIERVIDVVMSVVGWLEKHSAVAKALGVVVGGALLIAIGAYTAAMIQAAAATIAGTWPILLVVAACAALAAGVILLWTHWNEVWGFITKHPAYAAIIALLFPIVGAIVAIVAVAKLLHDHWSQIWPKVAAAAAAAWKVIGPTIMAIVHAVQNMVAFVDAIFHGQWSQAFDALKSLASSALTAVVQFFVLMPVRIAQALAPLALRLIAAAGTAFAGLLRALPGFAAGVIGWFAGLPGQIVGVIGDLGHLLYDAGRRVISGLLDGIISAIGGVKDYLGGVAGNIVSWKGPPAYDETILIDNGKRIMKGLRAGLASGMGDVRKQLRGFSADIGGVSLGAPTTVGAPSTSSSGMTGLAQLQPIYITLEVSGKVLTRVVVDESNRQGGLPIRIRVPS